MNRITFFLAVLNLFTNCLLALKYPHIHFCSVEVWEEIFDTVFSLSGGLAAEEPGESVARGPCWCHLNAEKTPTEHAHIHPGSAQKHEMETISSAGMPITLQLLFPCCYLCGLCSCVHVYIQKWTHETKRNTGYDLIYMNQKYIYFYLKSFVKSQLVKVKPYSCYFYPLCFANCSSTIHPLSSFNSICCPTSAKPVYVVTESRAKSVHDGWKWHGPVLK